MSKEETKKTKAIAKDVRSYYREMRKIKHHRFCSWEFCYSEFVKASKNPSRDEIIKLCIFLSAYLASWGMYRGSSFVLQKDFLVHEPIVKIILRKKYRQLQGMDCKNIRKEKNLRLIFKLREKIAAEYRLIRKDVNEKVNKDISGVLLSKILLGTLGCTPAYDDFLKKGIKKFGGLGESFSSGSIKKLCDFYIDNESKFSSISKRMKCRNIYGRKTCGYPEMKILDMAFWYAPYLEDQRKKKEKKKDRKR